MKNKLDEYNRRWDTSPSPQKEIIELEDTTVETIQTEAHREKKGFKYNEQSLSELMGPQAV